MKIEFPGNIHKKPILSEQAPKRRSETNADGNFASDVKNLESSSTSKPELLPSDSIMRLDVSGQIIPMKATDVLTAGEIEMLEKLFSDMRLSKGSDEYGKK